ncbi:MAG: hypothetical protein RL228_1151 [Actinomycetota bacterium]
MTKAFDFRFFWITFSIWLGALNLFAYVAKANHWIFLLFTVLITSLRISNQRKILICGFAIGLLITGFRYQLQHTNDGILEQGTSQPIGFQITSDPQEIAERFSGQLSFEKDLYLYADAQIGGEILPIALTVDEFDSDLKNALPSSQWQCKMRLQKADGNRRYVAFGKCVELPQKVASASRLQSVAGVFRDALKDLSYTRNESDGAALLPGLVVGDNQAQSDDLVKALQLAGLGHLTAVSGANVAILLLFVQFILQLTQISDKWRFVILLFVLAAFVVVARPSPSVVRAALMGAITLFYWFKGYQKLSEAILFLAVIVLLIIDPWLAISWGFALSVAATLGLILLPRFWAIDSDSPLFLKLGGTALAASLATAPILFAMGSPVTFATIPANILAEFFVAPATVFGLLAPILTFIPGLSWLAQLLANLAIGCASIIVWVARYFSNSIFALSVISFKGLFLLSLIVLVFRFRKNLKIVLAVIVIGCLALGAVNRLEHRWRIADWEIAVCDIGQGDATLIRTGESSAMVVDAGPDKYLMKKCLTEFGISKIDLFVASHFHADHIGGISALVDIAKPARVITAQLAAPNSGVEVVQQALAPLAREIAYVGMSGELGGPIFGVTWQVLAPSKSPESVDDSNGSLINNNSLVLLVSTMHHRVLLTGDIEIDAQNNLMNSIANPAVDIVKVPHHGSAYQSPDFASWVGAEFAWISVSADNDYGHPNPTTISLYQSAGSQVLSTKDCGHIVIGQNSYSTSRSCV